MPLFSKRGGDALIKRFHAWWDGVQIDDAAGTRAAGVNTGNCRSAQGLRGPNEQEFARRSSSVWTDPQYQIKECMWGTGFVGPGGADYVSTLIKPLGLDSSMSVVEFGASLGGSSRQIHQDTGAWVTGYERSPLLVEAAAEQSAKAGMTRQVKIVKYEPANISLRPESAAAVFSKEALFRIENKAALLKTAHAALRTQGHLLFTDYMLGQPEPDSAAVEDWLHNEPSDAHAWSLEEAYTCLNELGFEVRVSEDTSIEFKSRVLKAIAKFMRNFDGGRQFGAGWRVALLNEVELWARRLNAMESGNAGVYRIYAWKKPAPVLR